MKCFREPCARCGKIIWVGYKYNLDMEVCRICRFRIKYDLKKIGYLFDIIRQKIRRLL